MRSRNPRPARSPQYARRSPRHVSLTGIGERGADSPMSFSSQFISITEHAERRLQHAKPAKCCRNASKNPSTGRQARSRGLCFRHRIGRVGGGGANTVMAGTIPGRDAWDHPAMCSRAGRGGALSFLPMTIFILEPLNTNAMRLAIAWSRGPDLAIDISQMHQLGRRRPRSATKNRRDPHDRGGAYVARFVFEGQKATFSPRRPTIMSLLKR